MVIQIALGVILGVVGLVVLYFVFAFAVMIIASLFRSNGSARPPRIQKPHKPWRVKTFLTELPVMPTWKILAGIAGFYAVAFLLVEVLNKVSGR
jgi:hypothetical protein